MTNKIKKAVEMTACGKAKKKHKKEATLFHTPWKTPCEVSHIPTSSTTDYIFLKKADISKELNMRTFLKSLDSVLNL